MSSTDRLADTPRVEISVTADGDWHWAVGRWVNANGELRTPYIESGTTWTRWGARRAVNRFIRKQRSIERRRTKGVTFDVR